MLTTFRLCQPDQLLLLSPKLCECLTPPNRAHQVVSRQVV